MGNYRVFVEKKAGFNTEALNLKQELTENLHIAITGLRVINVYEVFNITRDELELIKKVVLSEIVTDNVFEEVELKENCYIYFESLPGQYDQRADSAEQCIKLVCHNEKVTVKCGKLIIFAPMLSDIELNKVKQYLINPIELCEKVLTYPLQLNEKAEKKPLEVYNNFIYYTKDELKEFISDKNLAMNLADIEFIQEYFLKEEKRNPTEVELYVLDTYWSDHCRHTTFETILENIIFPDDDLQAVLQRTFNDYQRLRNLVHEGKKPMTLMDLATIKAKAMRKNGELPDLEISDEVNACSVYIDVKKNQEIEKWLLMFKNETHNHPTEIEPFGGASTCIGGAIRDPLSGRSYVYQAMRVSGAANILEPIENTREGKLPQLKIAKKSAEGYSSYGNQIGLATTHVREIYHEGFKAKRMEVGAVVGAVRASEVKREQPTQGDLILLIGGRTGRDGIGGATGSSKVHTEASLKEASSEVQKGNAPTERKIQRLFRNNEVTKMIKKCNDFGAGGVAVAIGEIADGIEIYLDKVPTKYDGLNEKELAISESQERMAVVIDKQDLKSFIRFTDAENLECTVIAIVTDTNRLIMKYHDKEVVNISREFLNSNGVRQKIDVEVNKITKKNPFIREIKGSTYKEKFCENLKDDNVVSTKGLIEMFDASIGSSTVLMPFGGMTQLSEVDGSVQKIPVLDGDTTTCSIMTYGYNPFISSWSPFHGAIYAIIESLAKFVSLGGDYQKVRFTFQEYFKRLGTNPKNWGDPFVALLGALYAQNEFNLPAIGGKDSMSGSFEDLHVPPTLISFAVGVEDVLNIISPEFKEEDHFVYLIKHHERENQLPDFTQLKRNFAFIYENIKHKRIVSAFALKVGGIAEAISKMSFGNKIGVHIKNNALMDNLFNLNYGSIIIETKEEIAYENAILIGKTVKNHFVIDNEIIQIDELINAWLGKYNAVYPVYQERNTVKIDTPLYEKKILIKKKLGVSPNVFIPVFPGTNCEYDSLKAFKQAGANTSLFVFKNRNQSDIDDSIKKMVQYINKAQIIMFSGGFSAGDEPDGSGKFITVVLLNERIKESIEDLLSRDGLILGICNGFQALIKSGLLPYGKIGVVNEKSPTLVKNDINRHVSQIVQTRITSNKSPWLAGFKLGEIHKIPISHGEGRFVASMELINELALNGQIATQYVDDLGNPTMDKVFNPNGSIGAIEGITSPDGKILGKMGHSERMGQNLYKNINGNKIQDIFTNGVNYFK